MIKRGDAVVWYMFCVAGMSPSQIDRELGMLGGSAHDKIVARWAWDKESHEERRRNR